MKCHRQEGPLLRNCNLIFALSDAQTLACRFRHLGAHASAYTPKNRDIISEITQFGQALV